MIEINNNFIKIIDKNIVEKNIGISEEEKRLLKNKSVNKIGLDKYLFLKIAELENRIEQLEKLNKIKY